MPWLDTNAHEQRTQFIRLASANKEPINRLCRYFGISRTTAYLWLNRYRQVGDLQQLTERSRRPHTIHPKADANLQLRILELRDQRGSGAKKITNILRKQGVTVGRTTVHRVLQNHGRVPSKMADSASWVSNLLCAEHAHGSDAANPKCEVPELSNVLTSPDWKKRKKAVAVLARIKGIPFRVIAECLALSPRTVARYVRAFELQGVVGLFPVKKSRVKNDADCKSLVFSILHRPPSDFGINRTSWRMTDLHRILVDQGQRVSEQRIRRAIKSAGFRWRKARVVLTSRDPEYTEKLRAVKEVLASLTSQDAFFSIDEFGPFAVKKKGGRKRVGPDEQYIVPQWQKSKGWLILTAALELSTNQVTHFYSRKKNTDEMIKMADLLRSQYRHCRRIYLSWDAASWHVSKRLKAHLQKLNREAGAKYPSVGIALLPAGAQFLNVIESVFSGMARAIIHNSDYPSVEAAMSAIDQYFESRNSNFADQPTRAGHKIWELEREPCLFSESNNCKDPLYR